MVFWIPWFFQKSMLSQCRSSLRKYQIVIRKISLLWFWTVQVGTGPRHWRWLLIWGWSLCLHNSPQLNPIENIWEEIRERWFSNKVSRDPDSVIDTQKSLNLFCQKVSLFLVGIFYLRLSTVICSLLSSVFSAPTGQKITQFWQSVHNSRLIRSPETKSSKAP